MKVLKIIGLILISIIVILFIALPTSFNIEEEIVINQNVEIIFNEVNNLKNWQKWSPWQKLDTEIKNTYSGAESGVGSINNFSSANSEIGIGKIEILESNENNFIKIGLYFDGISSLNNNNNKPNLINTIEFQRMNDNFIKVKWKANDTIGLFSFYRLFLPIMEITMEDIITKGLSSLKEVSEEYSEPIVDVEIGEEISEKFTLITLKDTTITDVNKIKKNMGYKFIKLVEFVKENNIDSKSLPFTIKHKFDVDNNQAIYEYGLPVFDEFDKAILNDEFNLIEIGGNYSVSATHTGSIKTINQAHNGIVKYLEYRNYELEGFAYQYHLTNPDIVDEWSMVTKIVYPVKKK